MFRSRGRKTQKRKGFRQDSPEIAGEDGVAYVADEHGRLAVDEASIRFRGQRTPKRPRREADTPPATVDEPSTVDDDDGDEAWEDVEPEEHEPPVSIHTLSA